MRSGHHWQGERDESRESLAVRLHWLGMLLLGLLALLLLTFGLARAQETKATETKKPWTGKLTGGREITQTDLNRILQAHALWLKGEGGNRQTCPWQTCHWLT